MEKRPRWLKFASEHIVYRFTSTVLSYFQHPTTSSSHNKRYNSRRSRSRRRGAGRVERPTVRSTWALCAAAFSKRQGSWRVS